MAKVKRYFKHQHAKKSGHPPGSLIYLGPNKDVDIEIKIVQYDKDDLKEYNVTEFPDSLNFFPEDKLTWINITGLHQISLVEELGQKAKIHSLTLEDLLNVNQRPKIDIFHTYVYIVFQALTYDEKQFDVEAEQISLILGKNFVLTFLEKPNHIFEVLLNRMRNKTGKIRNYGSDYLAYAILDVVVDEYYAVIEKIGERIETFEETLMTQPYKMEIQDFYNLKRELLELRRAVWPIRDIVTKLDKNEVDLITEKTSLYLRDLYDHSIQIIETAEIYRDLISGLVDMYLSATSNKLNEIIKVLTILSSIFIPLTFIAGVYGMNFRNMPELYTSYGYFVCLVVMGIIAVGMLLYFKIRKWI